MKNLYNAIEQNLKAGLCVVVKDLENNKYCSILNHKDKNGNYRDSSSYNSIEVSKKYIGDCCGYSKEWWDSKDLEIVEVFRPEYEPFKVGQKVRILDSIKKTEDWCEASYDLIDMRGKIASVHNNRKGKYYSVNGWYIGHEYLAPLIETKEIEEMTMDQICKELGREVKIKK